jgi:hypothetical protein
MKTLASICIAIGAMGLFHPLSAAIVIEGNASSSSEQFTVTITEDLVFTATTAFSNTKFYLVLDGLTPGSFSGVGIHSLNSVSYYVNGTPGTAEVVTIHPKGNANFGGLTPDDGLLVFKGTPFSEGDTITIPSLTLTYNGTLNYTNAFIGTFSGNVFLADVSGEVLTNSLTIVPEPSAALLAGVGAMSLLRRRRK